MDHDGAPQPLISFILPVYNAEPYLKRCLDAISSQSFPNLEIIAVDGASNDGSKALLDERQRTEPRLNVLHEPRIGPGAARNLGAEKASGRYLWFVDADDVIVADCLTSIVAVIEVAEPEVLLVGYEIVHHDGRLNPGQESARPRAAIGSCFTVAQRPAVLNRSLPFWNKVIQRDFYFSTGEAFDQAWPHEDVRFSCILLLTARKLYQLDQVCYRYSKDQPGSAMRSGEARRHFRVFEAWQPVLCRARKLAESGDSLITDKVYRVLFERAIWHYSTILDTGGQGIGRFGADGYVARRDRREFFRQMHADFATYAPGGYRPPGGLRGVKLKLVGSNSYGLYSVLDPLNKARNILKCLRLGR